MKNHWGEKVQGMKKGPSILQKIHDIKSEYVMPKKGQEKSYAKKYGLTGLRKNGLTQPEIKVLQGMKKLPVRVSDDGVITRKRK